MMKTESLLRWAKIREEDYLWHLSWDGYKTLCGKGKGGVKLQWWQSLHSVMSPPQPIEVRCEECSEEIAEKLGLVII